MKAAEFITETSIRLSDSLGKPRAWIEKVYAKYPQTWQNNHVMPLGGEGDGQQFAMFELIPSLGKKDAVEVKWFQAYPLRQGVGSRAMQELQAMARADGISLTLFPWQHGQVSQSKLTKFYKRQGFKPTVKGGKAMQWTPELVEGLSHPIICVDVQPEYSGMNDGDENSVFPEIINFVNKQTGPVLMFVNAEDQGMSGDTVQSIKQYWDDTVCPEDERFTYNDETDDYDENPDCPKINWQRFTIVDKGYGYFRAWMDQNVNPATIIKVIRFMYQSKVNDSRELFGGENEEDYAENMQKLVGPEFDYWMLSDPISVNWTSIAQLRRFNGAYLVGGGRNQCLQEVELLMSAFNTKYKRIDRLVYGS